MSADFPLGRNAKLNELMVLVAVSAADKSGNGCDLDVIRQEADRAAKLWEEHTAYNPNERLRGALEATEAKLAEDERTMIAERKNQYGSSFTSDQRACIEQMFRQRREGVKAVFAAMARA